MADLSEQGIIPQNWSAQMYGLADTVRRRHQRMDSAILDLKAQLDVPPVLEERLAQATQHRTGQRPRALEQLQGCELAAGAWESEVLAARVDRYQPGFLDALCRSGEVAWGRLSLRAPAAGPAARRTETRLRPG